MFNLSTQQRDIQRLTLVLETFVNNEDIDRVSISKSFIGDDKFCITLSDALDILKLKGSFKLNKDGTIIFRNVRTKFTRFGIFGTERYKPPLDFTDIWERDSDILNNFKKALTNVVKLGLNRKTIEHQRKIAEVNSTFHSILDRFI